MVVADQLVQGLQVRPDPAMPLLRSHVPVPLLDLSAGCTVTENRGAGLRVDPPLWLEPFDRGTGRSTIVAESAHVPWFARVRARIFGRTKSVHNGGTGRAAQ
jgi:hypothetical protein